MIPVKLTLRNFMCYRDNVPPVNFEGIHTACISGNNGNGKSALIDAITWALWGQTRAASDDDLIYTGQKEVQVEFDFALGPQRYRIIRRHSRPKTQKSSGQTILEFQTASPEGYRVLSGDTVTQTQQKISQTLHMDYETFINSAFLKQGRADEFTKKRPGERKQVLGNILQLSIYDELEDLAKERAREQETAIALLEATAKGIQEDLARKPVYQAEFERAQNELSKIESLTKEKQTLLSNLRKDKEILENKKAQLAEMTAHLQDTKRNCNLWSEQAGQYQAHIKTYEGLISQRSSIEENFRRLIETRQKCQEIDQKFKQVNSLIQGKHRLEIAIIKAGEELNSAHAVADNKMHELEIISKKLPQLEDQQKQVIGQLKLLQESEAQLGEMRENSKLLRARMHFLQAEKDRLARELEQVEEKLHLFSHQQGVACPLCETELGEEGQKLLQAKYLREKTSRIELINASQAELKQKGAEASVQESDILQSEAKLKRSLEIALSKTGNLNKAISDAREAAEKINLEKKHLDEIEQRLAQRDFAVPEQEALCQIEKEIAAIGYDPQQHELLRAQLAALEPSEASKRKLEEADRLIIQEREAETRAQKIIQELRLKLENDQQRRQALIVEVELCSGIAAELALAEAACQDLLGQQKRLQEVMGGAKAGLERLSQLEARNKEIETQISRAAGDQKIFKDLTQAFGKKGIQAMLIEMAIPEIEIEANKLLARMTDNRMHIKMETQKETKKGDVVETLDINISDELGTRNYEMFSGGEAFRIDFAIRIALSKLLARRAGAPLPTLIIDEGFGTQDAMGIEKIKEAITSIQDDFEKILVITHILDFKDAFPMRIEVVKTAEGSTLYLN